MLKTIAMWSGPRNISTAMMRAFENREDTCVSDEPLYAHYLNETGLEHPGAAEVIASQENDWGELASTLTSPPVTGHHVWYQKHMTHHLLPERDIGWVRDLTNCFLIRDPAEVLSSYTRTRGEATLNDLGYPQQLALFRQVEAWTGSTPPVLDARDVLKSPDRLLGLLCDHLGIEMHSSMLSWPSGPRETDGVWGKYWYENVWRSTGFQPYEQKPITFELQFQTVEEQARPIYEELAQYRLI